MASDVENTPTLSEWNTLLLQLNEALIGKVTPNLRRVAATYSDTAWTIDFVLEMDTDVDREEIGEVVAAFEALQTIQLPLKIRVLITTDSLPWPHERTRVAYWRREEQPG